MHGLESENEKHLCRCDQQTSATSYAHHLKNTNTSGAFRDFSLRSARQY